MLHRSIDTLAKKQLQVLHHIKLVHVAIGLMGLLFVLAGILLTKQIVEITQLHIQVSQIARYDEAVSTFYDKFSGLPGDLLATNAYKVGLASGDGTPGHSDGDGKISPCNLGWQWHLGCETALFWGQLSATGLISENFSADNILNESRLQRVGLMDPYLPKSPLGNGIYIAIWNTDPSQSSPKPHIPYGNYYEISRISGILHAKMADDANALTPSEALSIDSKMDDGLPYTGRVIANGGADWPRDAWGTFASHGAQNCVYWDKTYNTEYSEPLCHLAISLNCCNAKPDY